MSNTSNHSEPKGDGKKQPLNHEELSYFSGDLERYRHPLNRRVIYTPGVRYVADKGEAYWLIDAIASWIGSESFNEAAAKDPRIGDLHFWTFKKRIDEPSVLFAKADSPEEPFISQLIEFTDFPLEKIDIWAGFDGDYWTLYLPSEH